MSGAPLDRAVQSGHADPLRNTRRQLCLAYQPNFGEPLGNFQAVPTLWA